MRTALCVLVAAVVPGCAANITVSTLDDDKVDAGATVPGIPFRVAKRYKLLMYEKKDSGYEEVRDPNNLPQMVTLPDPKRLYLLEFKGQAFSSGTVDLVLNNDNTIQQLQLKSSSTAAANLTALSTQLAAVAKAKETADKAQADAAKAAATAATSATNTAATLSIAADKAQQAAQLAELQYQTLLANPATTPEDLLKARLNERSKKLDANEAARLAGKGAYYPDVVP